MLWIYIPLTAFSITLFDNQKKEKLYLKLKSE